MTTLASSTERATAVLHLVRHGESTWNVDGRIQGQSPYAGGLTTAGRAQAERTANDVADRLPAVTLVVASDLPRARQTAHIIAARHGLSVLLDPSLREQRLGDYEGHRFADPLPGYDTAQDAVDRLWRDPFRRPPGGESIAEMYRRVHRALHRLATARDATEIVVVTHGGPIRVATASAPPVPDIPFARPAVANASITPWRAPCPAS